MPSHPRPMVHTRDGAAGRRRRQVLSTLLAICRSLERLQSTPEERLACRQVGVQLAELRTKERRLPQEG